ncbi:hypothetical protein [Streptomyces sp. SDr-06]|uniref:hypothetical protein n=1 Tax=Streptomyces sp. SDr-06 TaxID=2267702 RepID=UPI000DEB2F27|nr:hypothetical protein [Streptomyces sp. SDr-06]
MTDICERACLKALLSAPSAAGSLYAFVGEAGMDFVFVCGWCDEECVVFCERTGFWGTRFLAPEEFDCWACGGASTTPPGPWTPAD